MRSAQKALRPAAGKCVVPLARKSFTASWLGCVCTKASSRAERYSMFDDPEDFHWDDEEPEDGRMPALVEGDEDVEAEW